MSSVAMCREHQRILRRNDMQSQIDSQSSFVRGVNQARGHPCSFQLSERRVDPSETQTPPSESACESSTMTWQNEYEAALLNGGETLSQHNNMNSDHEHQRMLRREDMQPPRRFMRGVTQARGHPFSFKLFRRHLHPSETQPRPSESACESPNSPNWQSEYASALFYGGETLSQQNNTHRDHALLSRHRQDGVVAPWSPGSGVNEEMDSLVRYWSRRQLGEHDVQVDSTKDLLQRVESEPTQFALDEVGAVLHDSLQLDVSVPALPPRDEVQHVGALSSLSSLPAGIAGESDAQCGEDWEICGLVPHSQEPSEEVDLASDCGNGQKAGSPHD
jgi:hypothetical protein